MNSKILIVLLALLAFGCVAASQEKTVTVDTGKPVVTEPMPVPGEQIGETVVEEPKEILEETPAIETRQYTDPRGKITLEYPKNWILKTETKSISNTLNIEFVDAENYPDDKIRINYGVTIETKLEEEEQKLKNQGIDIIKLSINGQEFLTYDTELEPLPGKRVKERIAITIRKDNIYKISLTAKASNFDALLPSYNVVLESVQFLEEDT